MRARRKKNLDKRANLASDVIVLSKTSEVLGLPEDERYDVYYPEKLFDNDNPVELEIGCGKGDFACGTARDNPHMNLIAMERVADVACLALEKAKERADALSL